MENFRSRRLAKLITWWLHDWFTETNVSESGVVEHFAKKQKKAKSMANQEDVKSNKKMTEGKNEVSVR